MAAYLRGHPEAFMSVPKELRYFGTDVYLPIRNEKAYLECFAEAGNQKVRGEASPFYLYSTLGAPEIKAFSPDARIIAMVRNPAEMLHSLHSQMLYNGMEDIKDFEEALAAESDRRQGLRIPRDFLGRHNRLFYSDIIRFAGQLQRYFDVFGRDRVHVVVYDDLKSDTAGSFRKVCEFLEINPNFTVDLSVMNPNKTVKHGTAAHVLRTIRSSESPLISTFRKAVKAVVSRKTIFNFALTIQKAITRYEPRKSMSPELHEHLATRFAPEVDKLSALLGRDLSGWNRVRT